MLFKDKITHQGKSCLPGFYTEKQSRILSGGTHISQCYNKPQLLWFMFPPHPPVLLLFLLQMISRHFFVPIA